MSISAGIWCSNISGIICAYHFGIGCSVALEFPSEHFDDLQIYNIVIFYMFKNIIMIKMTIIYLFTYKYGNFTINYI